MFLTSEIPNSWVDLQDKVCKYLVQAGYHAETAKTIDTVRGKVEVDVYATAEDEMLKQFICECKYWDSAVPKEKIHAFRTVVQDSGSMFGIFISKSGYQSGAIEAASCSNVLLKDWNSFTDMISLKWYKNRLGKLFKIAGPLSIYTDPLDVPEEILKNEIDREKYKGLLHKYIHDYVTVQSMEMGDFKKESVDLDGHHFVDANSLLDYLEAVCSIAVKEFEDLFQNYPIDQWKFECLDHMGISILPDFING